MNMKMKKLTLLSLIALTMFYIGRLTTPNTNKPHHITPTITHTIEHHYIDELIDYSANQLMDQLIN